MLYRDVIGHLRLVSHKAIIHKYETIKVRTVTKRFHYLWDFSLKAKGIQIEGKDIKGGTARAKSRAANLSGIREIVSSE
jgi:hypothetical protein